MNALLVVTPGFEATAFLPLRRALEREGVQVRTLEFPVAGQTSSDFAAAITAAADAMPEHTVLVAHGFGATLSLMADPHVERMVLLAPVLAVVPQTSVRDLAAVPAPAVVDLSARYAWHDRDAASLLIGRPVPDLGYVSGAFVAEVQGWIRDGHVPVDLGRVDIPVWIAVGLADEVATVEATVPASRTLPDRALVRLGANRFDPRDYTHADLLQDEVPVRVAARAAAGRAAR